MKVIVRYHLSHSGHSLVSCVFLFLYSYHMPALYPSQYVLFNNSVVHAVYLSCLQAFVVPYPTKNSGVGGFPEVANKSCACAEVIYRRARRRGFATWACWMRSSRGGSRTFLIYSGVEYARGEKYRKPHLLISVDHTQIITQLNEGGTNTCVNRSFYS